MNDLRPDLEYVDACAMLYGLFSLVFAYPDEDLLDALADGELIAAVENGIAVQGTPATRSAAVEFRHAIAPALQNLKRDQLQSDYIALFELNTARPPLHLNAHLYVQGKPNPVTVYQRLIAIYRDFDIELRDGEGIEQPDHLSVQLEFLAWLYQLLGQSLRGESARAHGDIEAAICAFRTELAWVQSWLVALEQRGGHPLYLPLGRLLLALLKDARKP